MKTRVKGFLFVLSAAILVGGWITYFHLIPSKEAAAPDEDPDNTKNEIPVHTAKIRVATLHRYIDGFGVITPRPQRPGEPAGSANIASSTAGIVANVLCQVGQQIHAGDPLIQLDDRLAKSAEDQAQAALAQAQASLDALKATPRPDQLQIAQLNVDKSQLSFQFAQKNFERIRQLANDEVTSKKNADQAALDLASAQSDLAVNQKQLALLKNSPTPEELAQEQAKVAQARAALITAHTQRELMTITAPFNATVVTISINQGEAVDTTKPLIQLVAMDRLMVDLDVPADQLPSNALGLPTEVLLSSQASGTSSATIPSEPIIGKVAMVSPQVDPRNGSVLVGIDLPASAALKPGLSVRARIIAEEHKDCLAVPREAVVTDDNNDSVIALVEGADADHKQAIHKTVKTGLEENGLIEIIADGLKDGATVVTAGAFGLPQATRVKIID